MTAVFSLLRIALTHFNWHTVGGWNSAPVHAAVSMPLSLFTMGIIWYSYILSTVKAGFQGSKCQCALLLGRRTHQSSASKDAGMCILYVKLDDWSFMSIHVNTTLQTTTFRTYSTNGKGNSSEDSDEAGTAPPNDRSTSPTSSCTCNLSISKRHDIPLLEPRAQVLQSQHGWWTQKDGSNTHADAIQASYHGAALPCRRMVPWVYSG